MITPSQTVGPFFHLGLPDSSVVVPSGFLLHGQVFDGAGAPVPDALIETWQPDIIGFGRCATDVSGRYEIRTTGSRPYIAVAVHARGLLHHLVTRVYFAEDASLDGVPPARRGTLFAEAVDDGYRFDIHLQGEHETVFFTP